MDDFSLLCSTQESVCWFYCQFSSDLCLWLWIWAVIWCKLFSESNLFKIVWNYKIRMDLCGAVNCRWSYFRIMQHVSYSYFLFHYSLCRVAAVPTNKTLCDMFLWKSRNKAKVGRQRTDCEGRAGITKWKLNWFVVLSGPNHVDLMRKCVFCLW